MADPGSPGRSIRHWSPPTLALDAAVMHATTLAPDIVQPPADVTPAPLVGSLAPPPPRTEKDRRGQEVFRAVNKWATVPMLRAGLGPWLGTPIGGYLLLLRARGRTSGVVRETPLSYFIAEGAVWVCAGFGPAAQWYRNILADPRVEVVLPARTIVCVAEHVPDPDVRRRMMPALVRAIGLPGALGGVDPRHATDERILEAYGWVPLVRLSPVAGPLAAGPDDPGGTAWIWRQAVVIGLVLVIARTKIGFIGRVLGRR
jgi:deazaflavin-dependent oxidoreductase (nitroreductase family)